MTLGRTRFPRLFSPIDLGPCRLAHRVVIPGHSMALSHFEPGVSDRYRAYLVARASGGAALVGIESAPVHETSQSFSAANVFDDAAVPSLRRAADEIHRAGSKVSIILWHGGHNVPHRGPAGYALAPSPIPGFRMRETPRVMTRADIAEIVEAYGAAARRCRAAGIDVLEVQTATDYLLGHFLSHRINWREDDYGGSLENRARIVREVLTAVRAEAGPGIAVGVRTSIAHLIPRDPDDYGHQDSLAAMQHLEAHHLIDYVSLITGSAWASGQGIPPLGRPRALLAEQAKRFKSSLTVPVTLAGRIRTPAEAEAVLAAGQADIVAMARPWIAEPEWMNKVAEGREDEIRPCVSCNQGCLGFVSRGLPGTCVLHPGAGREVFERAAPRPASRPKRIAVIGGGPAGLESARLAALAHHQVTLYEASDALGGQLRLAAAAPHRGEMALAIDWWRRELERLQVRVVLGHRVTPAERLAADRVVWAIGGEVAQTQVWRSRPYLRAGIPGAARLPHGRDVMGGNARVRGHVLVIDEEGGWPAISLIETLLARPDVTHVTVATVEATLGGPEIDFTQEGPLVRGRLKDPRLTLLSSTLIAAVEGDHVRVEDGGPRLGPFEAIVLATGVAARPTPDGALAVGDCFAPRTIYAAVNDAARIVAKL